MATYHLNFRHCSKAKGQSAKAKSDYIDREDKYSKRLDDLQYSSSGNMPSFAKDNPKEFWECADIYERSNARVCTEIVFALPRELDLEQQKALVSDFVKNTIDNERQKLPYSLAIHNDKENHNPHCHLIFSERHQDGIDRPANQFFKRANSKNPEQGGAKKSAYANSREFVQDVRTTWRELANQHLERHGHTARIDERTLAEQGIDREPSRRVNRVEYQEIQALEREIQHVRKELTTGDKIIYVLQKQQNKREVAKNSLKSSIEPISEKANVTHQEINKTPQRAIYEPKQAEKSSESEKRMSQEEFDEFLVKEWLKPSRELARQVEHLGGLRKDYDSHVADLKRIQAEYDKLTEKNQGFLGFWISCCH